MKQDKKKKVVLTEQLQAVLDTVGDLPEKEPEIYDALQQIPLKKSTALNIALKRKGLSVNDFPDHKGAIDLGKLFDAIRYRVTAYRDEEGDYKAIPGLETMRLPNFVEAEAIEQAGARYGEALRALQLMDAETATEKEIDAAVSENSAALAALEEIVWLASGLKRDGLDDWKQGAVMDQMGAATRTIADTALGKR